MASIDITGLNKKQILRALWENSKPASFFSMGIPTPAIDEDELIKTLESGYADYLCGRVIKTDFKTDSLNPRGYDRDNGQGAMQKVVDSVRARSGR